MNKLLKIASPLFLIFQICGMSFVKAEDPEPLAVSIDPFTAEVTVEPGEQYTLDLIVTNSDDMLVDAKIELYEFSLDTDGSVSIDTPNEGDSPVDWLSLSNSEFKLAAGEQKTVVLTIDVPEDTAPKGNYVSAVYTFTPEVEADSGQARTIGQFQSLIAIKTGTSITVSGKVESAVERGKGGEMNVVTSVSNAGDVHFNPIVTVRVKNMFGGVVEEFTSQGQNLKVLPGGVRNWSNDFCLTYGFGKYTIETEAILGSGGQVVMDETSFTYFSPVVIGLIAVLVVGSVVTYVVVRRKKKVSPDGMMSKPKEVDK